MKAEVLSDGKIKLTGESGAEYFLLSGYSMNGAKLISATTLNKGIKDKEYIYEIVIGTEIHES